VVRHSAALLSLAVLCNGSDALARNPRDVFNQFAGIPQSVVTKAVQAEWRNSPDAEITCVGQNLRPGGSSKSALISRASLILTEELPQSVHLVGFRWRDRYS
jgi:hypothetical protein